MTPRILSCLLATVVFASTADAQSSLGIHGFNADFNTSITDDDRTTASGLAQLDVRVTPVHGLQLDIGLADHGSATIGHLGAHFYMQPRPNHKFGLFATVSDVDDVSIQYMTAGLEGRMSLSPDTALDARLGIGGSTGLGGGMDEQWDYVFAGVGVLHALTPHTHVVARVDITEYDEELFRAIGADTQVRLSHSVTRAPIEVYAEVTNSTLVGRDDGPSITTLGAGVVLTLGAAAAGMMDRPFDMATPFDQLVIRDLVGSF